MIYCFVYVHIVIYMFDFSRVIKLYPYSNHMTVLWSFTHSISVRVRGANDGAGAPWVQTVFLRRTVG